MQVCSLKTSIDKRGMQEFFRSHVQVIFLSKIQKNVKPNCYLLARHKSWLFWFLQCKKTSRVKGNLWLLVFLFSVKVRTISKVYICDFIHRCLLVISNSCSFHSYLFFKTTNYVKCSVQYNNWLPVAVGTFSILASNFSPKNQNFIKKKHDAH